MKRRPSRTTNRLHFSDLDPVRFEDLCLSLIYPLHPWEDIRHYGRQGGDDGVDIFAVENLENGDRRKWIVQCKRYAKASRSDLVKAIDEAVPDSVSPPEVLLLIASCDISKVAHEAYEKYAFKKGVSTPLVWTQSILEAKLYSERQDLLFSYFGVSQASEARESERRIKRNLVMKRRVQRELLTESVSSREVLARPNQRFCSTEAIIHSIDDSEYPWVSEEPEGSISGWFKLEFWDTYFNGIEFILGIREIVIGKDEKWAILSHIDDVEGVDFFKSKVWHIGRIPYRNIVEIDSSGDEYYPFPHIYCRFADRGEPYEGHVYRLIDRNYHVMNNDMKVLFKDLDSD